MCADGVCTGRRCRAVLLRTIRSPRARRERNRGEEGVAERWWLPEGERERERERERQLSTLCVPAVYRGRGCGVSLFRRACMYASSESHPLCNELKLVKNQRRVCVVPQSGDDDDDDDDSAGCSRGDAGILIPPTVYFYDARVLKEKQWFCPRSGWLVVPPARALTDCLLTEQSDFRLISWVMIFNTRGYMYLHI